jgi:cytochrome c oxidase assembly protein subunit 15
MRTQDPGARAAIARFCALVLHPTRDSVRGLALALVIASAVLVCTGAAVRLSSSGLGCPDWPQRTQTSVVAAHSAGQTSLNTAIEFSNRLLTFPLAAVALAVGLHFSGAARAVRASRIVLAGLAAEGAIGYARYLSHLPAGLVWVHVAMAAVLWILVLRLYLSTRERQPLPTAAAAQAGAAPAKGNRKLPA